MKLISIDEINTKQYKDKYFYFKKQNNEQDNYYIFKILNIEEGKIYTKNGYMFSVQRNSYKAFLYELKDLPIVLDNIQNLYALTEEEFRNTYYTFFKYDRCPINELPGKLIQDI